MLTFYTRAVDEKFVDQWHMIHCVYNIFLVKELHVVQLWKVGDAPLPENIKNELLAYAFRCVFNQKLEYFHSEMKGFREIIKWRMSPICKAEMMKMNFTNKKNSHAIVVFEQTMFISVLVTKYLFMYLIFAIKRVTLF